MPYWCSNFNHHRRPVVKKSKTNDQQLDLWSKGLSYRRFTLERMLIAKLDRLADGIDKLSHSDVIWLSRIEEFFNKHQYITDRQSAVLDSIVERHVITQ